MSEEVQSSENIECNFQSEHLAQAWAEISKDGGDIYRQLIINPIIFGIVEDICCQNNYSDDDSPLSDTLTRYYYKISENGKKLKEDKSFLHKRFLHWPIPEDSTKSLDTQAILHKVNSNFKFHILDLGCGEGYRGRWLGKEKLSYTGVDYSTHLLDHAEKRAKKTIGCNAEFQEINIEECAINNPEHIDSLFKEHTRLVLAITLLDHLSDNAVTSLLKQLRTKSKQCYMLVAACNPSYYKSASAIFAENAPEVTHAMIGPIESIHSATHNNKVSFYARSASLYRKIFRDCNITIIDEFTPLSPNSFNTDKDNSYDKGTGPFNFWLLRLHGRIHEYRILDKSLIDSVGSSSLGGLILTKLLEHGVKTVECMTVDNEDTIIHMNNRGGNLYIILEGKASLSYTIYQDAGQPKKVPQLPFGAGAVFGDLEVFGSNALTHYRQSVVANERSIIIIVPEKDACELIFPNQDSINGEFLATLKRRLLSQIWLMDFKIAEFHFTKKKLTKSNNPESQSNNSESYEYIAEEYGKRDFRMLGKITAPTPLGNSNLQRCHCVSAILIAALEYQRINHPKLAKRIVFVKGLKEKAIGFGSKDDVSIAIRILISAGIIYAAPLGKIEEFLTQFRRYPHQTQRGVGLLFKKYTDSTDSCSFFMIEDEWALRRIAGQPSYKTTLLLDNLLFLNGHYCSEKTQMMALPILTSFADYNSQTMKYSPNICARLESYSFNTAQFIHQMIDQRIMEDSLGFSL